MRLVKLGPFIIIMVDAIDCCTVRPTWDFVALGRCRRFLGFRGCLSPCPGLISQQYFTLGDGLLASTSTDVRPPAVCVVTYLSLRAITPDKSGVQRMDQSGDVILPTVFLTRIATVRREKRKT